MKKINSVLILIVGFVFTLFVCGLNSQVDAKVTNLYENNEEVSGCIDRVLGSEDANFWEYTCSEYNIEEGKEDFDGKYQFKKTNHNYTFNYDYEIRIKNAIDGLPTKYFVGIVEPTTITFSNLPMSQDNNKPETFVVYEFVTERNEFTKLTNFSADSEGNFEIDQPGIYRLETLVKDGGTDYVTYVLYETDFYYSSLRSVGYDSENQALVYNLKVNTPIYMNQCNEINVYVDVLLSTIDDCKIEKNEVAGEYDITITAINPMAIADDKYTTIEINNESLTALISYDSAIPTITEDVIYYPQDMIVDEFALQYNDEPLALPKKTVAKFKFEDHSFVEIKLNGNLCEVKDGSATCYIDPSYGTSLYYTLTDMYGNEEIILHSNISYVSVENLDIEDIKSYLEMEENRITFTGLDEYDQFEKICLFYGLTIKEYKCANVTSELSVTSDKYYAGEGLIVLVDGNMNIVKINYSNLLLNNGYDSSNYKYENIEGNTTDRKSIITEVEELILLGCNGDTNCLETVEVYGKYGDNEELLTDEYDLDTLELPTYLDIVNKGFSSKSCAFNRCNETIEVYVTYLVGDVKQKLSATYSFIDKLPQINMNIDGYNAELKYDFSELDINDWEVKVQLFSEPRYTTLLDGYGTKFAGMINTRFIKYIDREGNVFEINQPYTYISNKDDFGFYLLEGKITLTKNLTLNQDITTSVYGKSFYIKVELADTKAPVLKLIGNETMVVKQYDVFKDPEVKCEDSSICSVNIKYYYENEDTEVDKIDTSKPGKYIIKYFAVDGDNNKSELTRTVSVESVNAMNATSIIIIVVIVLVFAGSITLAIIIERKRRKEEA